MSTEYRTLISLTDELRCAVQSDLVPLSGRLVAEHLISPDNASQLRNPMHSEAAHAANQQLELTDNSQEQVTHSQVPDPSSVRGSDHSSIKQRVIHRTGTFIRFCIKNQTFIFGMFFFYLRT